MEKMREIKRLEDIVEIEQKDFLGYRVKEI
jgi:hypothetical protein